MEVFEAIKKRRSVRRFDSSRAVTDNQVEKLLDAARLAPSAGNLQSWYFVVVRDQEIKEKLVAEAWVQDFITEAPVVIVVYSDLKQTSWRYGRRGKRYTLLDTAMAAQNLMLAAAEIGLGTCFLGAFDDTKVTAILGLDENFHPVGVIPVGYPAESPAPPERRSLKDVSKTI